MIRYILMLLWPMMLYIISKVIPGVYETDEETGLQSQRFTKSFAVFSVLPYIYWAAKRPIEFGDTLSYARMFWRLPTDFAGAWEYMQETNKDPGFYALSIIIKMTAGDNYTVYFAIIAMIQMIPIALVLRRYSEGFITSIFVFIASTDYFSWMFNGIRQFTAVAIVFSASWFLFEKKYVRYCIAVAFASLFHMSALMMIPIAFVARGKPWRVRTFLLIAAMAFALIYVGSVTDWLDDSLQGTQYENVVTEWEEGEDDGTNPIRVLVYSIPAIMSFFGLRIIREADDRVVDVACNMSIIASIIYIFSMLTSGVYVGRLPIYCSIFGMELILPWLIDRMFSENSAKVVSIIMVAGFASFYYYQMHFAWGAF